MLSRRGLLFGAAAAVAAPAIIRPGLLMPVKQMLLDNALLASAPKFLLPDVAVFDGFAYHMISRSLLRHATAGDQILGIITRPDTEARLYHGDLVTWS